MVMNPVVHFEMPAEDKARMRKFYESAFGWKTHQLGKEMGEYVDGDGRKPNGEDSGDHQRRVLPENRG